MRYIILTSVLICKIAHLAFGANILVFMPLPLKSHTNTYKPLFKELALRGHNVTFYTNVPFIEDIPNLKQIVIRNVLVDFFEDAIKHIRHSGIGWRHIFFVWELGITSAQNLFKEQEIQELIRSKDSYDLVLLETFFIHEAFIFLGHKFNAPVVNLHPFRAEEWIDHILRNPQSLSYAPNMRLPFTDNMDFYQRVTNVVYNWLQIISGHYYYLPKIEKIMKSNVKYPGSENIPPILESIKNTSITLIDGDPVVAYAAPSLPSFITVGGIHILANKKLPEDIEKFINESPNGVIYFSFGSVFPMSRVPKERLAIFIKVLGSLPQRVFMKWELDEKVPGLPANVYTSKWFPQMDILAHPKCLAFITHGGFHSVIEAAYFGKPIVGMPIFVDQENNLVFSIQKGFGQMLIMEDLNEEALYEAINKVITDPSFKKNAESLSKILKDQPMRPMEKAIFWIEHVLRHNGAKHLQVTGSKLHFYQYYLLDVIVLFIAITIILLFLFYKTTMILLKKIKFRSRNSFASNNKKAN